VTRTSSSSRSAQNKHCTPEEQCEGQIKALKTDSLRYASFTTASGIHEISRNMLANPSATTQESPRSQQLTFGSRIALSTREGWKPCNRFPCILEEGLMFDWCGVAAKNGIVMLGKVTTKIVDSFPALSVYCPAVWIINGMVHQLDSYLTPGIFDTTTIPRDLMTD
jgi:hypothetical protein